MNRSKSITSLLLSAAFAVIGLTGNAFSQIEDANIPFVVNVDATVTISRGNDFVTMTVESGVEKAMTISADKLVSVRHGSANRQPNVANLRVDSRGNLNLNLPQSDYHSAAFSLYSINGRRVMHTNVNETTRNFSRPNVAPGVYIMSVKGVNGNTFTTRLNHRGGVMNVNVSYGEISNSNLRREAAAFSTSGNEWNVRVRATGYVDSVYTLAIVSGDNPTQNITLREATDEEARILNANWTNPFSTAPVVNTSVDYFENITVDAQGRIVVTPNRTIENSWDMEIVQKEFNYVPANTYVVTLSGTVTSAPVRLNITIQEDGGEWDVFASNDNIHIPVGTFTREVTLTRNQATGPNAQFAIKFGFPNNGTITLNSVAVSVEGGAIENPCPANATEITFNTWATGDFAREEWFQYTAITNNWQMFFHAFGSKDSVNIQRYDNNCVPRGTNTFFETISGFLSVGGTVGTTNYMRITPHNPNSSGNYQFQFNLAYNHTGIDPSIVVRGTMTDSRDNKTYNTITILGTTWMAENLNYEHPDSKCYGEDGIYTGESEDGNFTVPITVSPEVIQENCVRYGRMYDWATTTNLSSSCNTVSCESQIQSPHQGICPAGWHVATDDEWYKLHHAAGDSAATRLRSQTGWASANGTDIYGFAAMPGGAGFYHPDGVTLQYNSGYDPRYNGGSVARWWRLLERTPAFPERAATFYDNGGDIYDGSGVKTSLHYVRCVKD